MLKQMKQGEEGKVFLVRKNKLYRKLEGHFN